MNETTLPSKASTDQTQNHLSESSLQELRVRVAELCGWSRCRYPKTYREGGKTYPHSMVWWNDRPHLCMHKPGWGGPKDNGPNSSPVAPPNFCNDLNACAEFEKALNPKQRMRYSEELYDNLPENDDGCIYVWSATAEQRCRAFVAVMEASRPEAAGSVLKPHEDLTASGVSASPDKPRYCKTCGYEVGDIACTRCGTSSPSHPWLQ